MESELSDSDTARATAAGPWRFSTVRSGAAVVLDMTMAGLGDETTSCKYNTHNNLPSERDRYQSARGRYG